MATCGGLPHIEGKDALYHKSSAMVPGRIEE